MTDPALLLTTLRGSHDRLTDRVRVLGPDGLRSPSYDSEWTIAQVLSHLGSQAEIFTRFARSGLEGTEPPAQEDFPLIWDAWNARSPDEQAADSVVANEEFLRYLEGLEPERLGGLRLAAFGRQLDADDFLRMRLAEHAVHSWDVAVMSDAGAEVAPDAVELLVDGLGALVERAGRAASRSATVEVVTTAPSRRFRLVTDGVRLEPVAAGAAPAGGATADATADATVELPAEALVRLVYGRLDDNEAGRRRVRADGIDLEQLRSLFPGV